MKQTKRGNWKIFSSVPQPAFHVLLCVNPPASQFLLSVTRFVQRHTSCSASHVLFSVTRLVQRHTSCSASHILFSVTRLVQRHSVSHILFVSFIQCFLKRDNPGLFFFIFVFSIQLTVNFQYNFSPTTGFEPRTSGFRSDRSTNWATTISMLEQTFHFLTRTWCPCYTSTRFGHEQDSSVVRY